MIGRNVCYTIELPLYTNVIDYTAIVNGKDVRPFMSSLYTVTIGIAKTIAGALLGFGLATVVFDKAAVTTEAVQGIRVLLSAVPCASLAIGMIALSMFNVTEEKLIALRKAGAFPNVQTERFHPGESPQRKQLYKIRNLIQ